MSNNKDKFSFANVDVEDDYLLADDTEASEQEVFTTDELKEKEIAREKLAKKQQRKKLFITVLVMLGITLSLIGFGLLWQGKVTLMAITDAVWFAFAIELSIAWVMFVYNFNIFSPLIYGTKSLFLMFVGKRPKTDYYDYMKNIQDNPIPSFYYKVIFITVAILAIPAIVLLIIML